VAETHLYWLRCFHLSVMDKREPGGGRGLYSGREVTTEAEGARETTMDGREVEVDGIHAGKTCCGPADR
jgi:hypothetical protein